MDSILHSTCIQTLCENAPKLNACDATYFIFLPLLLLFLAPISLGRTRGRKVDREEGYLMYPANAKLTIWAKHYNGIEDEWEAEVRRGRVKEKYLL